MNALRNTLRGELFHALRVAESDPDVSVIIIKGNGRCFSAGYDLGGGITPEDLPDVGPIVPGRRSGPRHLNAGYFLIWDLTKVVIAQAHGYCLAGGSELASYCDLFVVADDALIGYPPVRDMSPPDNCWFPWHLPMRKAKEMIFTGDPAHRQAGGRVRPGQLLGAGRRARGVHHDAGPAGRARAPGAARACRSVRSTAPTR